MKSLSLKALLINLVLVSAAYAQDAGLPEPSIMGALGKMVPMFIMLFFIWYFLVIKPQQAKLKDHENLIKSLKKGDRVVTTGGIIARVAGMELDHIVLEVSNNNKVKFEVGHILKLYENKSKKAAKAA